jgi:hypothetical protein
MKILAAIDCAGGGPVMSRGQMVAAAGMRCTAPAAVNYDQHDWTWG